MVIRSTLLVLLGCMSAAVYGQPLLLATEQAQDRFLLIDPSPSANQKIVWQWSPLTDNMVPAREKKWFTNPSEAKASADGKTIYFTCSGGAIGAIDVATDRLRWYTFSGSNPHSIEPLDDGYIATASSTGSFVKVFATAGKTGYIDSTAVDRVTLTTAHNVIWDQKTRRLWGAGGKEIVCWQFSGPQPNPAPDAPSLPEAIPQLHELYRHPLPAHDGHDLVRFDDSTLLLSTAPALWLFHLSTQTFSLYTACVPQKGIKSYSSWKTKTILVYPNESWWSDRVYNCDGSVLYQQDKARFYKVRLFPARL